MSASMRLRKRRKPYGTLIVLGLLALSILWILVPLVRTGEFPESLSFLSDFLPGEVLAQDSEEDPNAGPAAGKVRVLISGARFPRTPRLGVMISSIVLKVFGPSWISMSPWSRKAAFCSTLATSSVA